MSYGTPATVRAILVSGGGSSPSVDPATAASLTDDDLQRALDDASAQVDGRLAQVYTVPFADPAPPLVTRITNDMAAYLGTLTFRKGKDLDSTLEPIALRYGIADQLLTNLSNGTITLPGVDPSPDDGGAGYDQYDGRLFTSWDFDLSGSRFRREYEV